MIILAIAAILSFFFGQTIESIAITIAIFINAMIGFFLELKAVQSMSALQQMGVVKTKVRRENRIHEIDAQNIVPGDFVLLGEGDIITADVRIIKSSKLQVNESTLTGESLPVNKNPNQLKKDAGLIDRTNMLYKGTFLTRGTAEGIVVATGMQTEIGHISKMVQKTGQEELTPLEKRLNQLANKLIWVTFFIAIIIALVGILTGKNLYLMIETAVALAVAAIPEGLPIVATIALAKGMARMAQQNAVVNRLTTIETLGSTNIICTDKTGTLTENRMSVSQISLANQDFVLNDKKIELSKNEPLFQLLEIGVLCNNASLNKKSGNAPIGDPLEIALLEAGEKINLDRETLLKRKPESKEISFDPELKMMATIHKHDSNFIYAIKGAPESLLKHCSQDSEHQRLDSQKKKEWLKKAEKLAKQGLRIIGLAKKESSDPDQSPYSNLIFLGIAGMIDPPKNEVSSAIRECHDGGIKVIMITGDQPLTAQKIGLSVGLIKNKNESIIMGKELTEIESFSDQKRKKLLNTTLFARVTPKQKLKLIALHQQNHSIVAMTGDGANDAPALKKADIGVAMGKRGSQVAQQAADMVLRDDAFSTIVSAVKQGRVIFNNIRKFVIYLLSGNVGEIIAVGLAIITDNPLPLLPLQILYLNVVNDVFPALALGLGEGESNIMEKTPRKKEEAIISVKHWLVIMGYGFLIAFTAIGAFIFSIKLFGIDSSYAVTFSFLTLAFSRLWHVFNMRDQQSHFIYNEVTRNSFVWGALVISSILLIISVYLPTLSIALSVKNPNISGWLFILLFSLLPNLGSQVIRVLTRHWSIFK